MFLKSKMSNLIFAIAVVMMLFLATEIYAKNDLKLQKVEELKQEVLNERIINFLNRTYSDYYILRNFNFNYQENDDFTDKIEIQVYCDMKLVKNVKELPLLKGVETSLMNNHNENVSTSIYSLLYNDVMENYYLKDDNTIFTFIINKNSDYNFDELKVLNYKEILELDSLKIREEELFRMGKEIALLENESINYNVNQLKSFQSYDRLGARDYALAHAYDKPEYSSDCANFVSQCLCYGGGIPQTSLWKPGHDNWIRTGYNNNGGVVPYMVDSGYFYKENTRSKINAGCIVYWNEYSHVGLVTYGDTVTIKFSAHTTARKNAVLPESEKVSFYMYK